MLKASKRLGIGLLCVVLSAFLMVSMSFFTEPEHYAVAESLDDSIGGSGRGNNSDSGLSQDDLGIGDFVRNHRGMTDEQLRVAGDTLSPLTNAIGYAIGGIIILAAFGIFLITALDLLYIVFPPIRPLLYPAGQQQQGGAGGFGGGGFGGGGFGGGYGGGGQQQPAGSTRQWISDEAIACAALMGGGQQQQGGAGGFGGGGFGGGYGGGGQQQQPQSAKSVISTYFKKRMVFMIMFALCVVVLMSSKLLGTGANLALWFLKLVGTLNGYIPF